MLLRQSGDGCARGGRPISGRRAQRRAFAGANAVSRRRASAESGAVPARWLRCDASEVVAAGALRPRSVAPPQQRRGQTKRRRDTCRQRRRVDGRLLREPFASPTGRLPRLPREGCHGQPCHSLPAPRPPTAPFHVARPETRLKLAARPHSSKRCRRSRYLAGAGCPVCYFCAALPGWHGAVAVPLWLARAWRPVRPLILAESRVHWPAAARSRISSALGPSVSSSSAGSPE